MYLKNNRSMHLQQFSAKSTSCEEKFKTNFRTIHLEIANDSSEIRYQNAKYYFSSIFISDNSVYRTYKVVNSLLVIKRKTVPSIGGGTEEGVEFV